MTLEHKIFMEMREDCKCFNLDYCPLEPIMKEFIGLELNAKQIKCFEKFKYEESEKAGYDIGINEATRRWCQNGYAKSFRNNYNRDLNYHEIYDKIKREVK